MASSSITQDPKSTLSQLLSTLDRTTARLSTILSTSVGVDKFLLTIYYTLKLLYPQISRLRALRLRLVTPSLAKTAPALVPAPAVVAVQSLSTTDAALAATDVSLRHLAALVSEFRMISRLWGLLGLYRWARATWVAPPKDAGIVWGQIVACTGYQVLENVAYLAGKNVLRGEWVSPARQGKMWVLSCRFWFVHTVLEGVRLVREKQRVNQRARVVGEEKEEKVRAKEEQAAWYRAWYSNAGYAPMALHYSFASGLISDDVLGALGLVVAYNSFGHLWRQSAL